MDVAAGSLDDPEDHTQACCVSSPPLYAAALVVFSLWWVCAAGKRFTRPGDLCFGRKSSAGSHLKLCQLAGSLRSEQGIF